MPWLGRVLLITGAALMVVGVGVLLLDRVHLSPGRLPGDMRWEGKNWIIAFPLGTSLLLSVLLSLLFWAISRFRW